ncbi:MAG: hypothetical protein ACOCP8_09510, partial [archaeon]
DYIKYLREVEGCSISEIARRVKINWRTAQKYALTQGKVFGIIASTDNHRGYLVAYRQGLTAVMAEI